MKKYILAAVVMICLLLFSGCSNNGEFFETGETAGNMVDHAPLVVYYSFTGELEQLANEISSLTGGTVLRLDTEEVYPDDYRQMSDRMESELERDYLPKLKDGIQDIENYDTVFVGTALWDGQLPPAVKSFLADHDFTEKQMIPFAAVYSGDEFQEEKLRELIQGQCPAANVEAGLAVNSGEEAEQEEILNWLAEYGQITLLRIRAGETVLKGVLFDSPTAREFAQRLPMEVPLYQPADFAKAFNLEEPLKEPGSRTRLFELGGLAYWPEGPAVAVFFSDHVDRTVVPVYTLGKIIDDTEIFQEYEGQLILETWEQEKAVETAVSDSERSGQPVNHGFVGHQIFHGQTGDIHYGYYLPEDYREDRKYPMMVVMPGYDRMWFGEKSDGSNLDWNGAQVWTELDEDMIVVSAQLTDWGETSARQALELTEYFINHFSVDTSRIYGAGYSAGGETMSRAVSMRPELFTAYLHGASQWDGTYDEVAREGVAVYIYMAENDEYYGSEKARDAWQRLYEAYEKAGYEKGQIQEMLKLEIPDHEYFNSRGIYNYHGGGNILFDDEAIRDWILSKKKT